MPWRRVHAALTHAAESTHGVDSNHPPEVQQVALQRSCLSYELTVAVNDVHDYSITQSNLLATIQEVFLNEGIALLTPEPISITSANA